MNASIATFGEIAGRYISTVLAGTEFKPTTRKNNICIIHALQRTWPGLEAKAVGSITLKDCEEWFANRAKQTVPTRLNHELSVLQNVLDVAQLEGHITVNPARRVRIAKVARVNPVIPSYQEMTHLVVLLRALGNDRAADVVELLAYSGMRRHEGAAFTWGNVDFDTNTFIVTGGCQGSHKNLVRCVPLFPNLRQFLLNLRKQRGRVQPQDRVLRTKSCKHALDDTCRLGRLRHFCHQSMRHFFIKSAVEQQIDYRVIAEWIGHTDGGAYIGRMYDRFSPQSSLDMASRMTFRVRLEGSDLERSRAYKRKPPKL